MDDTTPAQRKIGLPGEPSRRLAQLIVGRTEERAFLREELASAIGGRGRLVLLGGEAGIGKTTLARDLAREADDAGVRVISGHCYDLTNTPPYGPWLELFRELRNDPRSPSPPAAFWDGHLGRIKDRSALFDEVRQFIFELARIRPVYLVLEDLHWADPASVELLRQIVPFVGQLPLLLVATYRVDELTRHHALFQHLPALVREGDGARIEPRPLDNDAYHALVAARYRLQSADEARLVFYLERHAEGNPFFAVELLRALEEDGLLRTGTDRSMLGALDRVVVPTLVRQVIDGRVGRLGEETRRALEIAAVIGQDVPLALWAELTELEEEALLRIVERLIGANLIEAKRSGTYIRFVHALTRETIYEGILPPRRRQIHRRAGETIARNPKADPDEVAAHFQQAGDPRACEWLVRASDRAQRVYAWVTASERLRDAIALLEGVEGQERAYIELVNRRSFMLRFSDTHGSIDALDEVERLARHVGDQRLAAEVQCHRGIQFCYGDRFQTGLVEMKKGLEVLESLPLDATRASVGIRVWFTEGMSSTTDVDLSEDKRLVERLCAEGFDFRRCLLLWFSASAGLLDSATGERFVGLFADQLGTKGGVRSSSAFGYHALGIAYTSMCRPNEARRAWERCRELFAEVDHFALIAFSLLDELRDDAVTFGAADPARRRRLATEAELALGRAGGAFRLGVSSHLAWLRCLVLDGRWDEADQILRDLAEPGNCFLRREITAAVTFLARQRGEPERAWKEIISLLPMGPATEAGEIIHQEGLFLQCLAVDLCLDAGDLATAGAWLQAHDRWLGWSESVLGRAEGQLAWARWHHAAGETAQARKRASEAFELAASPDQPLVRLSGHRLLGEIETSTGNYAEAAAEFVSALALAELCEAPFEQACTLLALAELHIARDKSELALSLLEKVRAIGNSLGATSLLNRTDLLLARIASQDSVETYPAGLTRREAEVLRLLARHQTDKEIAGALYISPHTASTHVKHVLTKLGAASRREAAAFAVLHGLE